MEAILASLSEHLVADLMPSTLNKAVEVYPDLPYHCYNSVQEKVAGRNPQGHVYKSVQYLELARMNRVLEFVKLLQMFRLEDQ